MCSFSERWNNYNLDEVKKRKHIQKINEYCLNLERRNNYINRFESKLKAFDINMKNKNFTTNCDLLLEWKNFYQDENDKVEFFETQIYPTIHHGLKEVLWKAVIEQNLESKIVSSINKNKIIDIFDMIPSLSQFKEYLPDKKQNEYYISNKF